MSKLPFFKFYPGDWVQDTSVLSLAAKGAWIDILCVLWRSQSRGTYTCNIVQWARVIRSDAEQARRVIDELVSTQICDSATHANGDITLTSRRQIKEETEREMNAIRQARYRSNGKVTEQSRQDNAYISSSYIKKKNIKKKKFGFSKGFTRPTPEQVDEYAQELGQKIDGKYFCDYYESKGWLVGKTAMKDWKSAVRTWLSNAKKYSVTLPLRQSQKDDITRDTWLKSGRCGNCGGKWETIENITRCGSCGVTPPSIKIKKI